MSSRIISTMQFSPLTRRTTYSPKADRRSSSAFLNDYAESLQTNFAPAAQEDDVIKRPLSVPSRPKQSSTFLRQRRTSSRSKSPGPRKSTTQETTAKEPEEWVPFPAFPRTFMRKVRENTPTRKTRERTPTREATREVAPQNFKTPVQEKKKKGFLRLAEEQVPQEKRFKNRNKPRSGRAHKGDFIKKKFGEMDTSTSNSTINTDATLSSFSGRSLPPLPDLDKDGDNEHFVEGLVYFAPASENTIRKMTKRGMPPAS